MNKKQRKFLVIRMGNIGDVLCTTPLLRKLRSNYPEAGIDFLTSIRMRDVVAANPNIDKIFLFKKVTKVLRKSYDYFFRKNLVAQGYTDVIMLDSENNESRFAGDFLKKSIDVYSFYDIFSNDSNYHRYIPKENVHRIVNFLRVFFGELDFSDKECNMDFTIKNSKLNNLKEEFGQWLDNAIMIHPRTTESPPYRGFKIEDNLAIIESLINKGYNVLLSGIGDDKQSFEQIEEKFGNKVKAFAGRSFDEFLTIISMVKCVVAAETGTAHIARALDIPVLVIAGPTNVNNAGPIGAGIYGALDLSCEQGPCWTSYGINAKEDCLKNSIVDCLKIIDIQKFNDTFDEIMKRV